MWLVSRAVVLVLLGVALGRMTCVGGGLVVGGRVVGVALLVSGVPCDLDLAGVRVGVFCD